MNILLIYSSIGTISSCFRTLHNKKASRITFVEAKSTEVDYMYYENIQNFVSGH